jgi:uncharacterized membrane protein
MNIKKLVFTIFLFASLNSSAQIGPAIGISPIDEQSFYLIPTTFFSAINLTTTLITIHRFKNPQKADKYRTNAIFAIISGSLQTAIGVANISADYKNAFIPTSLNIGIGATTIATSIIRLARKNKSKQDNLSFNLLYSTKIDQYNSIVGLRIIRRIN